LGERPPDICQTFLYHANVLGTHAAVAAGVPVRVGGIRVAESKWLRCRIERAAVRRMHSVVCVSQSVGRFASDRLGCESDRLTVIPNGVDVARMANAVPVAWSRWGWPDDAVVSLFVGRLHRQKGIELLQQQIDHLAPVGSNRRLLLVGDGPLADQLQRWVASIGEDRVKRLPWQADVAPLMRAARLLILPSHYEGMPNVVLEAMAAGRPVVCSRVQGSEELLSHRRDLQSFPPGDAVAMKTLAEHFLRDERLSDQIGRENQSQVSSRFSLPAMVAAYREHYRELLARRRLEL
jgi:glycosyltransferase involved in cell wall biosynthesis